MFCGWSPTIPIELHQGVGMILRRQKSVIRGQVCKFCGKAMFRQIQNSTMIRGWWGIIAFFANIGYVLHNLVALANLRSMPEPHPPGQLLDTPLPFPMAPGRPLLLRTGIWVSAIAIVIASAFAFGRTSGFNGASSSSSGQGSGAGGTPLVVGKCVSGSGQQITGIVDCSSPHLAAITAIVDDQSLCPTSTSNYFVEKNDAPQPGKTVCLDSSQ